MSRSRNLFFLRFRSLILKKTGFNGFFGFFWVLEGVFRFDPFGLYRSELFFVWVFDGVIGFFKTA